MALDQPLRDLVPFLAEGDVQGSHDKVEGGQELVGIVQRAVRLDLHLGGMQDQDAVAQLPLGLLDLRLLLARDAPCSGRLSCRG